MRSGQGRLLSFPAIFFALTLVYLISDVSRASLAEWIYPFEKSSLLKNTGAESLDHEVRRIQLARRLAPHDPRYAYWLGRLYSVAISEGRLKVSGDDPKLRLALEAFKSAIDKHPVVAEYHVGFGLFLQVALAKGGFGNELRLQNPLSISEAEAERALFLSPNHHAIRAYVATYFRHRGFHERSLALWRSILTEDPSQTQEILIDCFKYYRNHSFLIQIAPQERLEDLLRFQDFLMGFRTEGWGENVYLNTLPLLIERTGREGKNLALLKMIARSYRQARKYREAHYWYQLAFHAAETPQERASFLDDTADALFKQERFFEANAILKQHLGFSEFEPSILVLYVRSAWYLGERKHALQVLRKELDRKSPPPEWRAEFASMLYEEGRFQEARHQWQTLLRESQGTAYERQYRDEINRRILDSEQKLGR